MVKFGQTCCWEIKIDKQEINRFSNTQCLKTQKEDKKIADGWNVDFLYYYDIF